jgi:hypothetical protein
VSKERQVVTRGTIKSAMVCCARLADEDNHDGDDRGVNETPEIGKRNIISELRDVNIMAPNERLSDLASVRGIYCYPD